MHAQMGLAESFRVLSKSKYLGYITVLVLAYGLTMEFTEIVFKATLKLRFPTASDYMAFQGQYSQVS